MNLSKKKLVNYTLSETARKAIKNLAIKLGINNTSVVETAVRDMARKESIDLE